MLCFQKLRCQKGVVEAKFMKLKYKLGVTELCFSSFFSDIDWG